MPRKKASLPEKKQKSPSADTAPAPLDYTPVKTLEAGPGEEWRYSLDDPTRLELVTPTGLVRGYKDKQNNYYEATTEKTLTAYCSPEALDLIISEVASGESLPAVASKYSYSMRQLSYWIRNNWEFRKRYEEALWSAGHHAWEKAEILAQELAEGVPHKPTADSKAKALDYYAGTRDKLLKDEFMVKTKQEQTQDKTVTIVFQGKEEYTDEDRAILAKEVGEL